jgi:hypothetical protein
MYSSIAKQQSTAAKYRAGVLLRRAIRKAAMHRSNLLLQCTANSNAQQQSTAAMYSSNPQQ